MTKDEMINILGKPETLSYIDGDGHTLYKPEAMIAAGFPADFIKGLTYRHVSDYSNPKSVIFDRQGQPVDEMLAVTALSLHYAVAFALCLQPVIDYDDTIIGRGSMAQELSRAIRKQVTNVPGV
jgi:hypothetical protein